MSQVETLAFRAMGVQAFSCDIQACSSGHNEWHIRADATPFLKGQRYFKTEDGRIHHVPRWNLIIAHPPCTYLARSGSVNLYKDGQIDPVREAYGIVAKDFFQKCIDAKAECVCVENPVPMARWQLPKCDLIISPHMFGAPWTKKTCLWLKNLPPLLPTVYHPHPRQWVAHTRKQNLRSRSFEVIAEQMAKQWLPYI